MNVTGFVRTAVLTLGLAAPLVTSAQSGATSTPDARARALIEQWVKTRTTIAQRASAWQQEKEIAEQRIGLFENELKSLDETIAASSAAATEADRKAQELQSEAGAVRAAREPFEARIDRYEAKIRAVEPRLPAPLRETLSPLFARLPQPNSASRVDLSNRMVTVAGILNGIDKFNRGLTVHSESRDLPDGKRARVKVLYIGLAAAYAVNETGDQAWVGAPGDAGWTWTPSNEIAEDVARVVGMYERTISPPAYVPLPVQVN